MTNDTRSWWGVSVTSLSLFIPGKDPVPIVQETGWAPGPFWTGAVNLAPTRIPSPYRPACSQSLYRQSYRTHSYFKAVFQFLCLCNAEWDAVKWIWITRNTMPWLVYLDRQRNTDDSRSVSQNRLKHKVLRHRKHIAYPLQWQFCLCCTG
jgi:hypothetical protein